MTKNEPTAKIREIRMKISKEFNHDATKYIDYLNNQRDKYSKQIKQYDDLYRNTLVTETH